MAEHPAGHLVLKWLIEQDAKMKEAAREGKYKMSNPNTHSFGLKSLLGILTILLGFLFYS